MNDLNRNVVSITVAFALLLFLPNVLFELHLVGSIETYTVHNLNTGLSYKAIQEAISAPDTLDGHTILVDSGTYTENIVVNKSISLVGKNAFDTVISGGGVGVNAAISIVISANVSVSGFTIVDGFYGIVANPMLHCNITNNIVRTCIGGIYGWGVAECNISHNFVAHCSTGLSLEGSDFSESRYTYVVGNNVTSCGLEGMRLSAPNCVLRNNAFSGSPYNFYLENPYSTDYIDDTNTVDGKSICYWVNMTDRTVPKNAGYVHLVNCTRINIQGLHLSRNRDGLTLNSTTQCIITQNDITENYWGLTLNGTGNVVYNNNFTSNNYFLILRGSDNLIYHNNIVNNSRGNYIHVGRGLVNKWDNDYPDGGNYWSSYTSRYPNATLIDNTGIWDTPYTFANCTDRYPLAGMFSSFNISLGHSVDVISNSTIEYLAYFESNNTVTLHVSNMVINQTEGFCRLTVPHDLLSPPYTIAINGTQVLYTPVFENETLSIIYFSFEPSKLEIIIIPEFPSILILPLFMLTMLLASLVQKRKKQRATSFF